MYSKKQIKEEDFVKLKFFTEYFTSLKTIRDINKEENIKIKKFSNSNKNIKKLELKKDISDSEDYEIEYIEKMKKDQNMKIHVKQLNSTVWVSEKFPIKIAHFLPIIHILSFTSNEFSQLKATLSSNIMPFSSLPLKISFPICFSFSALLSVSSFTLEPADYSIFELNYINDQPVDTVLDNNYAEDFYERYYMERENLSESSYAKIRDNDSNIFSDDDKKYETEYLNTDRHQFETKEIEENSISNGGDYTSAKPLSNILLISYQIEEFKNGKH
jgi:hypothetical protein